MATFQCRVQYLDDTDPFNSTNFPEPTRPPTYTFLRNVPLANQIAGVKRLLKAPHKLEDCALQLYKYNGAQGDYGTYLDLESNLDEQSDDIEGFGDIRKNAIILRTQLSVRVHACIEKLLNSSGRELRRALFSLKQIFQDDKDLVHEFVNHDGLECLIKVGSEADQNYQNYILRALGQVMLYVDGMNGVIAHNETIQWLYSLVASRFRLVVKTALKLLLVFIEYTECNTLLLIQAVEMVDQQRVTKPWSKMMDILTEKDGGDTELLVYTITLINKALNAIHDQDTFYDMVDALEEQGIERVIRDGLSRPGQDPDLVEQFELYEAVLKQEDGVGGSSPASVRKMPRVKSDDEQRKSRRYSTGSIHNPPAAGPVGRRVDRRGTHQNALPPTSEAAEIHELHSDVEPSTNRFSKLPPTSPSSRLAHPGPARRPPTEAPGWGGNVRPTNEAYDQGVEPQRTQRRRRITRDSTADDTGLHHPSNESGYLSTADPMVEGSADILPPAGVSNNRRWMLYKISKQNQEEAAAEAAALSPTPASAPSVAELDNRGAVQSAAEKLQSADVVPPVEPATNEFSDSLSGMLNKARQGLSQASSAVTERVSSTEPAVAAAPPKSDSDLRWEDLERSLCRPLRINDMDFSDLKDFDDINLLEAQTPQIPQVTQSSYRGGGMHPPPPPPPPGMPPPPPGPPPAPFLGAPPPPSNQLSPNKSRRTVKLHWREARFDYSTLSGRRVDTIWSKLERDVGRVEIDAAQLEHLFESRSTDIKPKKNEGVKKEISVLDAKRSNAINIGLTVLPPPRTIKSAILKMDNSIMNREGIEKLLTTMLPTDEEKSRILEAQMSHPDVPLGSAEQFLLTLSSVSEIHARLALWAFRLDYDGTESEIAEPLMDLKQGIEALQYNKTFKCILALLLQIGNFLNNQPAKGFNIEYLSKVPEVKDTVHKHSLLYHLCNMIVDKFPRSTDLYSEVGAIARVSKVDFTELAEKMEKLEKDCKASWDHLRAIAKHDSNSGMKTKLSDFLSDCAERIIVLKIVHKRMRNRFNKFLLFLGYPSHLAGEVKINVFCKIVSEFALEYRTTREKVLQQREKKANQRERRKTRGKMITETEKFATRPSSQISESRSENALSNLLHNGYSTDQEKSTHMSLPGARIRKRLSVDQGQKTGRRSLAPPKTTGGTDSESVYDTADDEMLDAVLKTATAAPLSRVPRDRKRARNRDRKSLRRTLKTGLTADEVASVNRSY